MSRRPHARCYRFFRCDCKPSGVRKGAPIVWSPKRLRAVPPKPPTCIWCGERMKHDGSTTYQPLLHPSWDPPANRTRVRAMFSAMLGRG